MSGMLVWAILLFFAGLAFLILEAFIPSSGLLAVLSAGSLIASIVMGYMGHWVEGTIILAAAVIGVPVSVALMLKYWPDTPIGRRVLLAVPGSEEVLPDNTQRKSLVGKRGRAKSVMLPSGAVEIEGELVDAVSEGMVIEKGQPVEVVDVRGLRVVVRTIDEDAMRQQQAQEEVLDDPLSQPIESLGIDSLEDDVFSSDILEEEDDDSSIDDRGDDDPLARPL